MIVHGGVIFVSDGTRVRVVSISTEGVVHYGCIRIVQDIPSVVIPDWAQFRHIPCGPWIVCVQRVSNECKIER